MNKNTLLILTIILFVFMLTSCAHTINIDNCTSGIHIYGFWGGLWHGTISPISFIASLFSDNITFYAVNNNGAWYNVGFVLGSGILIGGVSSRHR